jgi:hypothetical protein
MENAIAPDQAINGAVPPMVETVTPAAQGANPVANVTLEYPKRFVDIVKNTNNAAQSPEARVQLAQDIASHDNESKAYHPNQQPVWGKVVANLLSRNYNEALKWYNGGGIIEEEARDINNNQYFREKNDRGITGRVKDSSGKELTPNQIKELETKGGIFTLTDEKSLKTLPWINGQYNADIANKGLTSPLQLATNDAYNSARTAGGANHNIDEQLKLAGGLKGVLDHISTLPSERRQKLYGYVSRLNQIGSSQGKTNENGLNVNAGGSQTAGNTVGANVGGAGAGEGVPPTSGKLGAAIGASGSATNQSGVSGREGSTATNSSNAMLQEQQTLQTAILQELQGVIKPEQFGSFLRLQALNAANDEAYKNIPAHVKPPTWKDVASTDPLAGGAEAMIANRVDQQRNNALLAAWSKELYAAQREMAKTGKQFDLDKLSEDFQKSKIFDAINNTYKYKMQSHLEGRSVMPPKGSLMVNNRNEVGTSPGE